MRDLSEMRRDAEASLRIADTKTFTVGDPYPARFLHARDVLDLLKVVEAGDVVREAAQLSFRLAQLTLLSETRSSAHQHSERRADQYAAKASDIEQQIRAAIATYDAAKRGESP